MTSNRWYILIKVTCNLGKDVFLAKLLVSGSATLSSRCSKEHLDLKKKYIYIYNN